MRFVCTAKALIALCVLCTGADAAGPMWGQPVYSGHVAGQYGHTSTMPASGGQFGAGFAGAGPNYVPANGMGYSNSFIPQPNHHAAQGYVLQPQVVATPPIAQGQVVSDHAVTGAATAVDPSAQQGAAAGTVVHGGVPLGHDINSDPVVSTGPVYATQNIGVAQPVYGGGVVYQPNPYAVAMQRTWSGNPVVGNYYNYGRPARRGYNNNGCPTWFGSTYGLIMTRAGEEDVYLGQSQTFPSSLYLATTDAATDFGGGVEARIGRTFNCCRWGLELGYWGLFPDQDEARVLATAVPGTLQSLHDYTYVWGDFSYGRDQFSVITDAPTLISVRREEEFHNFEVNFVSGQLAARSRGSMAGRSYHNAVGRRAFGSAGYAGNYGGNYAACGGGYAGGCGANAGACVTDPCAGGCGQGACVPSSVAACQRPRLNIGWLLGVRYFRFNEAMLLGFDSLDTTYGYTDPDTEFFHDIEVENNLLGPQLGLNLDYYLSRCLHLDIGTRFGIYANHVSHYQRAYNATGDAYIPLAAGDVPFNVQSSEDEIAFLGELRAGIGYKIGCHARLALGYRAVSAAGVAIAADQIRDGRESQAVWKIADVDSDGSLLLHGAYGGIDFAW